MNYLIDEASDTGKGANTIVSLLHHYFQEHGLGETDVHLRADNCVKQNKNNTMLHYLLWCILVGLHRSITLSFLIVGHTKFSPDWCFGLLKQRFRCTVVGCLDNFVQVVNTSAKVNVAQLVGDQAGGTIVPVYSWTAMSAGHLRKLKNIKWYQHFSFQCSSPGVVTMKLPSDTEEESIVLLVDRDWEPVSSSLPPLVLPNGLSDERQVYLHDVIHEYCPEEVRNRVCPMPLTPPITTTHGPPTPPTSGTSMSF